jgi:hypothetical protein
MAWGSCSNSSASWARPSQGRGGSNVFNTPKSKRRPRNASPGAKALRRSRAGRGVGAGSTLGEGSVVGVGVALGLSVGSTSIHRWLPSFPVRKIRCCRSRSRCRLWLRVSSPAPRRIRRRMLACSLSA